MKNLKFCTSVFVVFAVICGMIITDGYAQDASTDESFLSGWQGDVFAGYSKSVGNTQKSSANLSVSASKKFDKSQFLIKGNLFYSESNKRMDTQKWDILTKVSHDFGRDDNWFSFAQVLVDHDYFSDIDYRVTPSAGLGYHLFKGDDFLWDVDGGLGYRITRHRVNQTADDEALTAVLHTFAKKQIFDNAFISEDVTIYPSLKSDSGVLLRSESVFTNPLSKNMDLQLKYILDYNSEPAAGKKKSDGQFIAGLKYKF